MDDGTVIVSDGDLPQGRFTRSRFVTSTVFDIDNSLSWQTICLHIPDKIGGPTRTVKVEIASDAVKRTVYLRSVEYLAKREFEEIFGFGVNRFVNGRVVALEADALKVD